MWLNLDGWHDHKAHYVAWITTYHKPSVLYLLDTRLDQTQCSFAATRIKSLLGIDYMVSTIPVATTGDVGGIIAIIEPDWKRLLTSRKTDTHRLGLYMTLSFKTSDRPITVIGT